MASIFKRTGDKRWTISYFDHKGERREKSSGTTDRRLAERLAAQYSDKELERSRGLVDPAAERFATERGRALKEQFREYVTQLSAMKRDERHIEATERYLTRTAQKLKWETLGQLNAEHLTAELAAQSTARGTSARSFNAVVIAWRAFARWTVRTGRLASNPLANLATRNTETDRRRLRRDVTPDELARVIAAAAAAPSIQVPKPVKAPGGARRTILTRMTYPERAWAYRIAAGTGFRASEIASLTRESFDLDADTPTVTVEAAYSKRKRRDVQPIRSDLADLLRPWLATKTKGERLALLPPGRAGQILQADMRNAREAWLAEAGNGAEREAREKSDFLRCVDSAKRVVDFHGLRVHYVSRVVEAGANVKQAMELARHSDPKLTMRTYARVSIHSLSRVLDGMPAASVKPSREALEMRATGTDDHRVSPENDCPQKRPQSARKTTKPGAAGRDESSHEDSPKSLEFEALRGSARHSEKTGDLGFEPRLTESESVVLPLHQSPNIELSEPIIPRRSPVVA